MGDARNGLLSWVEIDAAALRENLGLFRSLLPAGARLLLVVKANAYGHGLESITRLAAPGGADALGVHVLEEAARVRGAGWTGMLLGMGYVPRVRLEEAVALEMDLTVYDRETLDALAAIGTRRATPVACHLKLETGTHRQGIPAEELDDYLEVFRGEPGLRLAGLSTHFANIEDTTDHAYARGQLERFRAMTARARGAGFPEALLHCACTAAILSLPETGFDLARVGIGAYGIWPSRETLATARSHGDERLRLRPVLAWKARVSQVKWVPEGAYVGYGCAWRTVRRTRLAILPIGYADGYDRSLSQIGRVLLHGRRAQVLGRICMNMVLVDATDIPDVAIEDEAVLIGTQGEETISAAELAAGAQTIPYEIVSRISPALPRLVVDTDGSVIDGPPPR